MRNIFISLTVLVFSTACQQEEVQDSGLSNEELLAEIEALLAENDEESDDSQAIEESEVVEECPTFVLNTDEGGDEEVSNELVMSDMSGMASFLAGQNWPMEFIFNLKKGVEGCGEVKILNVGFQINVMGKLSDLEPYSERIVNPTDETGAPLWRGADYYRLTDDWAFDTHVSISHSQYLVGYGFQPSTPEDVTMYIVGNFTAGGLQPLTVDSTEWKSHRVNIFLSDRLPLNDIMTITFRVSYTVDGVHMTSLNQTSAFYIQP